MTTRRLRSLIAPLAALLVLGGCVSPFANHTPYQNPYFPEADFERLLASWKSGKAVAWNVQLKGTAFSDQILVVNSTGESSLGPRLPGTGQQTKSFTPSRAELVTVMNRLLECKVFSLYDGHYGAFAQGGGLSGPELEITVGSLTKHVSKDEQLNTTLSWEARAIGEAADAVVDLALKHLK